MDEEAVERLAKALREGRGPTGGDHFPVMTAWESDALHEWVREDFRAIARWLLEHYTLIPKAPPRPS